MCRLLLWWMSFDDTQSNIIDVMQLISQTGLEVSLFTHLLLTIFNRSASLFHVPTPTRKHLTMKTADLLSQFAVRENGDVCLFLYSPVDCTSDWTVLLFYIICRALYFKNDKNYVEPS
jgi:hypothetical protein